jgi:hypothetical protein
VFASQNLENFAKAISFEQDDICTTTVVNQDNHYSLVKSNEVTEVYMMSGSQNLLDDIVEQPVQSKVAKT